MAVLCKMMDFDDIDKISNASMFDMLQALTVSRA